MRGSASWFDHSKLELPGFSPRSSNFGLKSGVVCVVAPCEQSPAPVTISWQIRVVLNPADSYSGWKGGFNLDSPVDDLKAAIAASTSIGEALHHLHRARVGSNYIWLRERIQTLSLDISHWGRKPSLRLDEGVLSEGSIHTTGTVKRYILRKKLLAYECAWCGINTWRDQPLSLRLDHINGVRDDHRLENLRFLCPNCDSQSDTFCGRNKRPALRPSCPCGQPTSRKGHHCVRCATALRQPDRDRATKIPWPSEEELQHRLAEATYEQVARELGVSSNAIRKRLRVRTRWAQL